MKQIIAIKPGTLSPKDKEKLTKAGNIVIEHPHPSEIVYKHPDPPTPEVLKIELVFTTCYTCGDRVFMPKERLEKLRNNGKAFYCSLGHQTVFT